MPARSASQYGMMQAIAHGTSTKEGGPSKAVAQEFIEKTSPEKRHQFSKTLAARRKSSHYGKKS